MFTRCAKLFLCFVLGLAAFAWADVPVPPLKARVTDLTGTLSASQRGALESALHAFEARNGGQMAVLLVPTTQPESIEQYSIRVAEAWKLGRKGKDDGLLLLVAKNDRKVRIEVGYGYEGVIPDAIARRVIAETITPLFKQGDFAGGISAGVQRLSALIGGSTATNPVSAAPTAEGQRTIPLPSQSGLVMDLVGALSDEQNRALGRELSDFETRRGKPVFVLIVPTTQPETVAQYGARIFKYWGEADNLDIDRSVLLLVAKDDDAAHIQVGTALQQRMSPGMAEQVVSRIITPQLRNGEVIGAVQSGAREIEKLVDAAIDNKSLGERLADNIRDVPIWLLIALAVLGTALRWLLGPLFGGVTMGGLLGVGGWFVSGSVVAGFVAGFIGFIFVLVGISNWIALGLSSSSGGGRSGGGGFSGGGGSFGGGGASGSW